MKKFKLLVSLTLVLTLIMSVIVVAPVNAGAVKTTKAVSGAEVKTYTPVSGDYNVYTDSELVAAFYDISQKGSGSFTIALQADITHTGGYNVNKNTITIIGNGYTINFNGKGQGIDVYSGAVLNLGQGENDSLTLCGDDKTHNEKGDPKIPDNDNPGILHINGSASVCNMNSGVTIKNHRGNNYLGGGVTVESGTFNMNGGTIDRCGIDGGAVCYGGGVAVYGKGKFVMNGGTISNCYALSDYVHDPSIYYKGADNFEQLGYIFKTAMGGGVFVTGESTFIMNDGTITGNKSTRRGGGVCVSASLSEGFGNVKSKVVINGGTISSNESNVGGGIYVSGQELPCCAAISFNAIVSGTVEVENITGAGNKTSARAKNYRLLTGAGDTPAEGFNMNGGTVTDNTANVAGAGIEVHKVKEKATLKNVNVVNNIAKYTNGLIKNTNDVDGYFHFKENGCGGGVLIGQENSNVSIENCTISNNTSEKNGGGVALIEAKSYPTTIKNSTIKDNESNARGAGVYYDANSKLNMCGADIVQDNVYDNHLNNVNVLSTTNPIYVTGSLEGSKIGLSDPRLWGDNMTDAQAPDDGSAELLTNGYKANNPDVHPSKYFTSDHESWYVERTTKTTTTVEDDASKAYREYSVKRYPVEPNNNAYAGLLNEYIITNVQNPALTNLNTVNDILAEVIYRYDNSDYTKVDYSNPNRGSTYVKFTPKDKNRKLSTVIVNRAPNTKEFTIEYDAKQPPGGYVKYTVSENNQKYYANPGELILQITSKGTFTNYSFSDEYTTTTLKYINNDPPSNVLYEYDEDGAITAKLELVKFETKRAQITTESGTDAEVRLVRKDQPIRFHDNKNSVNKGEDGLFRVYNAKDGSYTNENGLCVYNAEDGSKYNIEDGIYELVNYRVPKFYEIPSFAGDEYVFAGWYYNTSDGTADGDEPFEFDSALPANVTDVYAHWIPVGEVDKDADDDKELPSGMNGKYKGFDLCGVQIRPKKNYDYNYEKEEEGGLRFVASISESLLSKINAVHTDNKIEYGFVTAQSRIVENVVDYAQMGINSKEYTLQYKGKNVNGVDTTDKTLNPNNFRYITNVDCTSKVGGYGSNPNIKIDHRNFTNYRLASYVVTYNDDESGKGENVAARAYLRYTDANGLLRTFYNNYSGTNFYGGCSTSYNHVKDMATNTKTVKN